MNVSIIMPVYNVADHLPRAIESALQQTYSDFELILVNDGSTDNSAAICEKYKQQDSRISVIHQQNKGSGPARNAGLDKAKGKYIYFADPDDYFEPTLLEDNVAVIEQDQAELIVFGFAAESTDQKGKSYSAAQLPRMPKILSQEAFQNHFRNFYAFSPYSLWNKLYKKDYLNQNVIRFTNQRLGQDALFNLSVYKTLTKVSFNRKVYYHYMEHEGSAVNRYRPDRFELEYNIAEEFEQLILCWNKFHMFRDLLVQEYWHPLYLELSNLTQKNCPLTKKGKWNRLEAITQMEPIQKLLRKYDIKNERNPFVKTLVYLLKQNRFSHALQLMALRNRTAKQAQSLFYFLKRIGKR